MAAKENDFTLMQAPKRHKPLVKFSTMLLYVILLLPISRINVFSQRMPQELPQVIKPSPEASAISRYAIYPVGHFTGIPNISIPLYEINVGNFNLPINLGYHASGLKVRDVATWCGLGWNLTVGGVITRTVMDIPDDHSTGSLNIPIKHSVDIWNNIDQSAQNAEYLKKATKVEFFATDTEPDIFHYNFGAGHSGKFYWKGAEKEIIAVPFTDLKIFYEKKNFKIVDTNGVTYFFDKKATSSFYSEGQPAYHPVTTWYLTKILLANHIDSLTISYVAYAGDNMRTNSYSSSVGPQYDPSSSNFTKKPSHSINASYTNHDYYFPSEVVFPGGKVHFTTEGGRKDNGRGILKEVIVSNNENTVKRFNLNYGYFYSNSGYNPFTPHPEDKDKYRLRLDNLIETGGSQPLVHRFEYNPVQLPPRLNCGVDYFGYFNGKENNQTLVGQFIGSNIVRYKGDKYALPYVSNRDANEHFMKACMLQRISYPTGGYTIFDFEANKFLGYAEAGGESTSLFAIAEMFDADLTQRTFEFIPSSTPVKLVVHIPITDVTHDPHILLEGMTTSLRVRLTTFPNQKVDREEYIAVIPGQRYKLTAYVKLDPGYPDPDSKQVRAKANWEVPVTTVAEVQKAGLRIKSISNFDKNNLLLEKQLFTYGPGENGLGTLSFFPYLFLRRTYEQEYIYSWWAAGGQCVKFAWTKLNISDNPLYSPSDYGGSKVAYPIVTRYEVGPNGVNGKTEYGYHFEYDEQIDEGDKEKFPDPQLLMDHSWKNGDLLYEKHFKYDNGKYELVKKIKNDYHVYEKGNYHGLKVKENAVDLQLNFYEFEGCFQLAPSIYSYNFFEYPINSGLKKLTRTIETDYFALDSLVKETKYFYDNESHLQPTRVETADSQGAIITVVNKYPHDKAQISNLDASAMNALDAMLNKNMITIPIESEVHSESTLTTRTRTVQNLWSPEIVLPKAIQVQQGSGPLEDRIQFHNYDLKGNILEQSKAGDVPNSFIWDYDQMLPIAKVINGSANQIAYTSFEADGKGNWTFSGEPETNMNSLTGKRVYNLRNGAIQKIDLSPAKTYTISFWHQSDASVNIEGGTKSRIVSRQGINRWIYSERKITGTSSVILSGIGLIDEVRLHPEEARMTTYTYDPLIGTTSSTDENNVTSYFEYDEFQRLKTVKDCYGNILKTYTYQFKKQ